MSGIVIVADSYREARQFAATARIERPIIVSNGNVDAMQGVVPGIVYDIRKLRLEAGKVSTLLRVLKACYPQVPIFVEMGRVDV